MSTAIAEGTAPLRYRPDFLELPRVAGIDEAGRGPLAGPVVAAAVVFPGSYHNERFQDSKALSARTRERLFTEIKTAALSWSIVAVGPRRIESMNILEASREAMRLALVRVDALYALIDGNVPIHTPSPNKPLSREMPLSPTSPQLPSSPKSTATGSWKRSEPGIRGMDSKSTPDTRQKPIAMPSCSSAPHEPTG